LKWINKLIKFCFVNQELPKGRILVLWRDVDGKVVGWNCEADDEKRSLDMASIMISTHKDLKTRKIVGCRDIPSTCSE